MQHGALCSTQNLKHCGILTALNRIGQGIAVRIRAREIGNMNSRGILADTCSVQGNGGGGVINIGEGNGCCNRRTKFSLIILGRNREGRARLASVMNKLDVAVVNLSKRERRDLRRQIRHIDKLAVRYVANLDRNRRICVICITHAKMRRRNRNHPAFI